MAKKPQCAANNQLTVAIGWYDAVQWAKRKQIADDADTLDDTYEAWQSNAEDFVRKFGRQGIKIQRVNIDVDALAVWCRSQKKPINAESRSQYAIELAKSDRNQ